MIHDTITHETDWDEVAFKDDMEKPYYLDVDPFACVPPSSVQKVNRDEILKFVSIFIGPGAATLGLAAGGKEVEQTSQLWFCLLSDSTNSFLIGSKNGVYHNRTPILNFTISHSCMELWMDITNMKQSRCL